MKLLVMFGVLNSFFYSISESSNSINDILKFSEKSPQSPEQIEVVKNMLKANSIDDNDIGQCQGLEPALIHLTLNKLNQFFFSFL